MWIKVFIFCMYGCSFFYFFTPNAVLVSLNSAIAHSLHSVDSHHFLCWCFRRKRNRSFFLFAFVCALKRACLHTVQLDSVWEAFISPVSTSITANSPILPPSLQTNYLDTENPMWGRNQCCHHLQTITADTQRGVLLGRGVSLPPHSSAFFYIAWNLFSKCCVSEDT